MLNRIALIGRLTNDPELRYTSTGTAVASFTLAVERDLKDSQGNKQTDFINIVTWKKTAELCAQYLAKGRMTAVDGRLQIRTYDNREGQKVRVTEVVAEHVQFLGGSERNDDAKPSQNRTTAQKPTPQPTTSKYADDPFADDNDTIDVSDDDLPF